MSDRDDKNLEDINLKRNDTNHSNSNDDIDAQIAQSMERLVEEETNVARAFVSGDQEEYGNVYHDNMNPAKEREDLASGKTQVIPPIHETQVEDFNHTRVIPPIQYDGSQDAMNRSQKLENDDTIMFDDMTEPKPDNMNDSAANRNAESNNKRNANQAKPNPVKPNPVKPNRANNSNSRPGENRPNVNKETGSNEGLTKKKKIMIAAIIAAAVLLIAGIVTTIIIVNNNRKSFEYNYNQGMSRYEQSNYDDALPYFEKAYKTTDGKKSADLMYAMYDCYMKQNRKDKAKQMLDDLISYDKNNEKGLKALAQYYLDEEDGKSLTELLKKYRGTKSEEYLKGYELEKPTASEEEGSYTHALDVTLKCLGNMTIYYTVDGNEPTENSTVYTDAVKIEKGTTTLKAITVNSIGLCSDVAEYKYVIDYKKPDAPNIDPASGSYDSGKTFTISNIADGDKAYYTLDGTDPTSSSKEYDGEVEIPEGNIVVCAIIINKYDMESAITRRNYKVTASKTYTYEEAVDKLKSQLISKNILKSDGKTASGNPVTMVSQNTIKVDGQEMYYIRVDESKNGSKVTFGYYGVNVKTGACYKVTTVGGSYNTESL